jgi:hypothetical protein
MKIKYRQYRMKMKQQPNVKKERIMTKSLGKDTNGYVSKSIKPVVEIDLIKFIKEEIHNGPQIVSLPVPPYRHAFLVDIQPKKIMISDWGGESNKTAGILDSENYECGWEQYSDFMIKLEKIYKKPIKYYSLDKSICNTAKKINKERGGGGCSYYIYEWVQKHYPKYKV